MKVGFCGLLALVFITLKLTGVIGWSWWWVTVPLWGGFALFFGGLAFMFILACVLDVLIKIKKKK